MRLEKALIEKVVKVKTDFDIILITTTCLMHNIHCDNNNYLIHLL